MTPVHWIIAGVVLFIFEVFAPGAFFLWLGVAAAVVGALLALVPVPWEMQWLLFCVLSVGSIFGWRAYKRRNPDVEAYPNLNQRGRSLVGRRFTLADPISDERGKVNVDDSIWKVRGPDLPAGTVVVVREVEGTLLVVEAAN
ncbi:MAG: NfeD family protein [Gammaproteobacteria bacterium]